MGKITRKEAIENLKEKRHELIEFWEDYKHENHEVQALDIAILSLETDEAYQLEYERTTKNDLGVDCISRADAISAVSKALSRTFVEHEDVANKIINKLPSVTPQEPRWIPVTEDVPPKGTICLWCNKQGSVFASEITYRSKDFSHVGKHGYFSNGLENYGDIVAWMPLPKAYREVEE